MPRDIRKIKKPYFTPSWQSTWPNCKPFCHIYEKSKQHFTLESQLTNSDIALQLGRFTKERETRRCKVQGARCKETSSDVSTPFPTTRNRVVLFPFSKKRKERGPFFLSFIAFLTRNRVVKIFNPGKKKKRRVVLCLVRYCFPCYFLVLVFLVIFVVVVFDCRSPR